MQGNAPTNSSAANPSAVNLFPLGVEIFGEVQRVLGSSRVRGLRIKIGNKLVKEVAIAPLSTAVTVVLVLLAVIVSTLSIEIDHEPAS